MLGLWSLKYKISCVTSPPHNRGQKFTFFETTKSDKLKKIIDFEEFYQTSRKSYFTNELLAKSRLAFADPQHLVPIEYKDWVQRKSQKSKKSFAKWKMTRKSCWKNVLRLTISSSRIASSYRWVPRPPSTVQYKGKSSNISLNCPLEKINFPTIFSSSDRPTRCFRDHLSLSLFTPRTRRFSCSSNSNGASSGLVSPGPRLAPRITQLRQEECVDVQNREATHEREVHSAISISQSYEDLTLVLNESFSFKNSEEFSNPLHVSLPSNNMCSSPSPTRWDSKKKLFWRFQLTFSPFSRHNVVRLQYGMSPSPTRRSFATRRSMSPIAIRPSPLGSVKRKFEMIDDGNSCSSSTSSSQPYKKIFTEWWVDSSAATFTMLNLFHQFQSRIISHHVAFTHLP